MTDQPQNLQSGELLFMRDYHTDMGILQMDCMQWLIDTSPRKNPWTPARMVGEIMAVWFGSVHQLAMV